jgi:hypothetical protein
MIDDIPPLNVYTDLMPEALTAIGIEIYRLWIAFALGGFRLGGNIVMHPTGRYASSISFRRFGRSHIAIIADPQIAPEAAILERGHAPIDMKTKLRQGQAYPMHRGEPGHYGSAGYGRAILAIGPRARASGRQRNIWAAPRSAGFSGFATVGKTGWVIPAMRAFAPAQHLADLARDHFGRGHAQGVH